MDPDAALSRCRNAVIELAEGAGDRSDVNEVVEAFDALDNWMCKGGFLPLNWAVKRSQQ